jgi:hypothetical protein
MNGTTIVRASTGGDKIASKTITFDGAAGTGATGNTTLFTITGDVLIQAVGTCSTTLVGATATISLGITGNGTALIASTTATSIQTNMGWRDASPSTNETMPTSSTVISSRDILAVIGTANITAGVLNIYIVWRPLSVGASVVPA